MQSYGNHVCGLFYTINTNYNIKRTYLPQVKLESHTTLNPVCFTTQLTQTFHNPNSESLSQVRYTFPLYDGVAVNGYTISYASKVLKGIVKQKDDAKKTYQAAVDRGETAGLLESLPAGVFGVTLGNVPANNDIVVAITYCGELKHDAAIDGLRYMLPTSIAPRYGNYPGEVVSSNTIAKGGISITVDVDMAESAIRKVQSPSHPIAVSMGATSMTEGGDQAPFKPSQASATLTLGSAELADDFVLQLLIDDISKPRAILETHPTLPNHRAIMTTLVPKFTLEPAHPEIVFIADQSGSMGGSKNDALVAALKIFLKSLPLGIRFNICAFGNDFKFLWPKSQAYNESNVTTAISFVDSFKARYGGTEILKPIQAAFKQHLSDLPLEVMLLTDGEIWGESGVFDFINEQVRDKGVDARVFALGIDGDVSHTLVEGVARAGNGFAQFVTQNEDTGQKVIRMLKGALYAHTKDYELEVHYDERESKEPSDDDDDFEIVEKVNDCLKIADTPSEGTEQTKSPGVVGKVKSFFDTSAEVDKPMKTEGDAADRYAHLPEIETPKLLQAPNSIPPLFPFNRTTAYLLLGPDSAQRKVTSVTLRATSAQGPLELNIPVHYSDVRDVPTIHQLAARKAVQDLEEGRGWFHAAKSNDDVSVKKKYESRFDELIERECVRLGEEFQVAGQWTSFVAVEDKNGEEMEVDESNEALQAGNIQLDTGMRHARLMTTQAQNVQIDQGVPAARRMAPMSMNMRYVTPSPAPFSSSTQGRGLFGGAPDEHVSTGGLFGNSTGAQSGFGNPFGSTNQASSLFGMPKRAPAASPGLFGVSSNAAPSGTRPASGNAPKGPGLFGFMKNEPDPPRGAFGTPAVAPPGFGNWFGSAAQASGHFSESKNEPSPLGGLYGNGPQRYWGISNGGFGGFGSNANNTTGGGLFGSRSTEYNTSHDAGPVFGSAPQTTGLSGAGFGCPASTEQSSSSFGSGTATTTRTSRAGNDIPGLRLLFPQPPLCPPPTTALSHTQSSTSDPLLTSGSHSAMNFSASAAVPSFKRRKAPAAATNQEAFKVFDRTAESAADAYLMDIQASEREAYSAQPASMMIPAHNRTGQTARYSTSGRAPRKQLASMAARNSAPSAPLADDDSLGLALDFGGDSASDSDVVGAMHKLIDLQTFSGAWAWEEKLFAILGLEESVVKAKEQELGPDAECRATALAIAFLETKVKGQKAVWEMVVAKARGWLGQQMGDEGKVDEAVAKAGTCF